MTCELQAWLMEDYQRCNYSHSHATLSGKTLHIQRSQRAPSSCSLLAPMAPLTWHFPVMPKEPQQPDVPFECCSTMWGELCACGGEEGLLWLYNVSSNILLPAWVPFAATKVAEEVLVFSLRLMTDDWMFERPSNQYFLGQFLKLEASVKQYNHFPLRIFVDGCVATAAPGVNTTSPRYSFIELRASGLLWTMSIGCPH
ncbi:zona pellucida sperm-binding protein 3-like [Sinocyclocheilus anshuiensis]|uniref:zona pellucida sperm-binding protein 3-like n=1 Tax=Sinocyclocheilus anshuiensis TaxID=1608454 RepID=UPI0007B84723|nr:PREDICTED: zona pellucida sperm-binding protein 3-like [Sinocyclocheilus anshuiensis]